MWWHPGIVLAIVPVWKEGRRDRDRWRDGIAVLMWHWGPSKVENLDIIDSYTGRSGIPIRMRWNVLERSEMTSVNSSEGPAGSRTRISSYHHHKYQTFMFLIIPPALVYLPLHCPYLCCLCRDRESRVFVLRVRASPLDAVLCKNFRHCWFIDSYPAHSIAREASDWAPKFIMQHDTLRQEEQGVLQQMVWSQPIGDSLWSHEETD